MVLSVIVYGRNDSHGYSLHKRATISLNAIAHLLSDPDDEIIFVDYNSPDEVPTFPETIADTLTEAARQRIRVIRVRPTYHLQFSGLTKLVALEPQSRNIAARRANPRNRWILSTNTDMVFAPHEVGADLSSICAGLADGFYHLPRFEVPEGFWERAERSDPAGTIEAMRHHGRRYQLNEIVYGGSDNLYEGPGDFQLFLREDLERIGGFDERMILGWHADSNIARRMRLLRGRVDTLFPIMSGYHCGHTRQATSLHGSARTENDLKTFVYDVSLPAWTEGDDWGAPGDRFEDFRLSDDFSQVYFEALSRAVPAASGADFSEARYTFDTFSEQGYDADHVLVHLADICFNMPAGLRMFVVGSDTALIEGFSRFATGAPLRMAITLWDGDGDQATRAPIRCGLPCGGMEQGLAQADVVLLQFPNARTVDAATRADLEWAVQRALDRFVAMERLKPHSARRRIIIVNGTHNRLQDMVGETIDAAAMPYSSRLRHGRVVDPPTSAHPLLKPGAEDFATGLSLGRSRGFASAEREAVVAAARRVPGWERLALELSKIEDAARWSLDLSEGHWAQLREAACASIATNIVGAAATPVLVPPRGDVACRLCSGADWEDSEWMALAERYFGERVYGLHERTRWLWERVSLLRETLRRVSPTTRPWVLVVAEVPDVLAAMISHQGYRVAYATPAHLLYGAEDEDWSERLQQLGRVVLPTGRVALADVPEERFAAVIAPSASLLSHGEAQFGALVARLRSVMAPGGWLAASTLVHLHRGREGGGALGYESYARAAEPGGLLAAHGLEAAAPIDERIPLDSYVKYAPRDEVLETGPGLSYGYDEQTRVTLGLLWARFPDSDVRSILRVADEAALVQARERFIVYPSAFAHTPRDLLPFVVADAAVRRAADSVSITSKGQSLWISLPIKQSSPGVMHVELVAPADVAAWVAGAWLIDRTSDKLTADVTHGPAVRLAFKVNQPVHHGAIIVAFSAPSVVLRAVRVWMEPQPEEGFAK